MKFFSKVRKKLIIKSPKVSLKQIIGIVLTIGVAVIFYVYYKIKGSDFSIADILAGLITELIGAILIIFILDWILNTPKKKIFNRIKQEVTSLIFNITLDIADLFSSKEFWFDLTKEQNEIEKKISDSYQSYVDAICNVVQNLNKYDFGEYFKEMSEINSLENSWKIYYSQLNERQKSVRYLKETYSSFLSPIQFDCLIEFEKSIDTLSINIKKIKFQEYDMNNILISTSSSLKYFITSSVNFYRLF